MYEHIYSSDVLPTPTAVNTAEEGIAVPAIVRAGYGSSMNSPSLVLSSQFWCVGDALFKDKRRIYYCKTSHTGEIRLETISWATARNKSSSSRSGGSQSTTEMLCWVAVCCRSAAGLQDHFWQANSDSVRSGLTIKTNRSGRNKR